MSATIRLAYLLTVSSLALLSVLQLHSLQDVKEEKALLKRVTPDACSQNRRDGILCCLRVVFFGSLQQFF